MVTPVQLVGSVLTEDWSDDYAASEHWSKYWNAVSAPSDDEWPEGLTEDWDKLFLKDKLLVPENRVEELIDHWHNAQLMHPGRDKMQQDLCCGLFLGNSTALLCLFVSQNPKSKIPIDKPRRIFRRGTNNNTISKT